MSFAGLTNISDVCAKKIVNGEEVPCAGNLYYRGYNIKDLVQGFLKDKHYGFEEIAYLLLFGELPDKTQCRHFMRHWWKDGHCRRHLSVM